MNKENLRVAMGIFAAFLWVACAYASKLAHDAAHDAARDIKPEFRTTSIPAPNPLMYEQKSTFENGCYIATAEYKEMLKVVERLDNIEIPAKTLYVDITKKVGHVVVVFYYEGKWRLYDSSVGTYVISELPDEPSPALIELCMGSRYSNAHWYP